LQLLLLKTLPASREPTRLPEVTQYRRSIPKPHLLWGHLGHRAQQQQNQDYHYYQTHDQFVVFLVASPKFEYFLRMIHWRLGGEIRAELCRKFAGTPVTYLSHKAAAA